MFVSSTWSGAFLYLTSLRGSKNSSPDQAWKFVDLIVRPLHKMQVNNLLRPNGHKNQARNIRALQYGSTQYGVSGPKLGPIRTSSDAPSPCHQQLTLSLSLQGSHLSRASIVPSLFNDSQRATRARVDESPVLRLASKGHMGHNQTKPGQTRRDEVCDALLSCLQFASSPTIS
jgi:hypothetical protein